MLKNGEQGSSKNSWASPLANYWTLARLDPLCKAGGKQEEEEKKKEQMTVREKKEISGSQKGKCEMVGRKRHGGEIIESLSQSFGQTSSCCYQLGRRYKLLLPDSSPSLSNIHCHLKRAPSGLKFCIMQSVF